MIQNSGDNSAQLTTLNEGLKEKEKLVEELQTNIANLQQELNSNNEIKSNLEKSLTELKDSTKTKIDELENKLSETINLTQALNVDVKNATENANDLNKQLEEKEK